MQIQLLRRAVSQLRSQQLWPGFESQQIPVAVYNGQRTWLWDHPDPPSPFETHPTQDGLATMHGRHPEVWANSTATIGGIRVATVLYSAESTLGEMAATIVHEQFHVFQAERFPGWAPNELDLLTYPTEDVDLLALRTMETVALCRACNSGDIADQVRWAQAAVRVRLQRFALIPSGASNCEAALELLEGLATYVERKAAGDERVNLPPDDWPPEQVRHRSYEIGRAWAMLLDRISPGWQQRLSESPPRTLHAFVADSTPTQAPAQFSGEEESRIYRFAAQAVEKAVRDRHQVRATFLGQPGARLLLEAHDKNLQPAGFDPQNMRLVGEAELLHTRYLKLRSQRCDLEVDGRAALTIGAGNHPLFGGVRQVLLTGLEQPPAWSRDGDWIHMAAPGVTGRFQAACMERSGERIRIGNN